MATSPITDPHTFTVDVWDDDSIWTWEGTATSTEEAEKAAVAQLNEDWEREYADFDEMSQHVDGTATMEHPTVMADRQPQVVVDAHATIVDTVRALLEDGRPDGMAQTHFDALEAALAQLS